MMLQHSVFCITGCLILQAQEAELVDIVSSLVSIVQHLQHRFAVDATSTHAAVEALSAINVAFMPGDSGTSLATGVAASGGALDNGGAADEPGTQVAPESTSVSQDAEGNAASLNQVRFTDPCNLLSFVVSPMGWHLLPTLMSLPSFVRFC